MTKKQSVPVKKKEYEPLYEKSTIKKFSELYKWLKQISRFEKVEDFIYISDYKENHIGIRFYTKEYEYFISAKTSDLKKKNGYLGCISQTRKSRAGEDWQRGRDLADGSYSEETWQKIKDDILATELVKVVRHSPEKLPV